MISHGRGGIVRGYIKMTSVARDMKNPYSSSQPVQCSHSFTKTQIHLMKISDQIRLRRLSR